MWRHGEEGTLELEEEDRKRREEAKAELEGNGKKTSFIGSRMFWAEVALAYTIHKIALLPFRAGLTVAWTPKVVRWLQARGWAGKVGVGQSYPSRALRQVWSRFDGDMLSITGWGPVHPILTSSALGACTDEQEGTGRAIAHAQQKYKDVKAKAKGIDKA
jgi:hypothetical protein